MAEDKQLTVAELLARSAKERERRGSADTSAQEEEGKEAPRRRRRRSLDEGGISVAELTGSIKRVKAEPSRSRHSEAADSASRVTPAPEKTEKPADTSAAKSSSAAEKTKPKSAETPAASKTSTPSKASTADKPAEKKESPKKTAKPAAAAASAGTAGAKADAKADSETVKKPDTPATDDTTVIKKVETEPQAGSDPVESKSTAKADKPAAKADKPAAKAEGKPAVKPAAARVDETTVMPAQPAPGKQTKPRSTAAAAPAAASASAAPAAATTDAATGEIPVVTEDARPSEAQVAQREEYDVDAEDDDKLSAVSIVVLSLVGIILGAIVFKGFEILWGRFDRIIVSILALVVTGAMVGVVHALRTARDSVSMTLAAIVGLVLTFGPLLIIVL